MQFSRPNHDGAGAPLVRAAIMLGSNLGNREANLAWGFDSLSRLPGTAIVGKSDIYETAPVGPVEQGKYLNAAAVIDTTLGPRALLDRLLDIERRCGRDRISAERWGPRTLDMDLILYSDAIIDEPGLRVPHERMHERLFVLDPLAEIAPLWPVPGRGATVEELRQKLKSGGGSV